MALCFRTALWPPGACRNPGGWSPVLQREELASTPPHADLRIPLPPTPPRRGAVQTRERLESAGRNHVSYTEDEQRGVMRPGGDCGARAHRDVPPAPFHREREGGEGAGGLCEVCACV